MREPGHGIHWAWVVLGAGFATLFVTFSIRVGSYPVLLPEMIRELGLTKAEAGLIKSAFSLVYLIMTPVTGWLTDRVGGRKVISLFCLLLGGGTFMMGTVETLGGAMAYYAVAGAGAAATWVPVSTLVQRWFGAGKRGLALGILSPSYGIGFGVMGLVLPALVSRFGWRLGWFVPGVAAAALLVVNGLLLRDDPRQKGLRPWGEGPLESEVVGKAAKVAYGAIVRQGRFWIIGAAYLAISYGTYTLVDFIVTYGSLELGLPYRTASFAIALIAFSGVAGGFLLMAVSDRVGRKASLALTQASAGLGIFWILLAGPSPFGLMTGAAFFGFFYGAVWPMYAALGRDLFPREVTGTVVGLLSSFYGVGAMVSPVVTGHLADVTGSFRWAFVIAGGACMASVGLIGFLKKRPAGHSSAVEEGVAGR